MIPFTREEALAPRADHNAATWWMAMDATHMPVAWPVVAPEAP